MLPAAGGAVTSDYALYGFTLRSELTLPAAVAGAEGADLVEVRFGAVAARAGERIWTEAERTALVFEAPDVARFRIADGREILIDPAPGASERNLRVYLLGSAMGALLHQRGMLPLHANAVELEGKAVAFAGRSGAGKSTLAAWFADRGHRILCDDVCAIAPGADGGALVLPGVPRLRLWEDALVRSGRNAERFERSFEGHDKYDVPAGAAAAAAPLPLAACYLLAEAGAAEPPAIRRLAGAEAVEALVANSYRGRFVEAMGLAASHLALCVATAARAPVHRAERRWGPASFDEEAERLRDHALANI
ncbi:MAG TPA: hypothetical protein VF702_08075 [Allosphingosinicella sp.]|jgi:hypothetical protein